MAKIDLYFKERFEQYEQQPPEATWSRIRALLGHGRRKARVLLVFRIAAGMALAFSLGIGYYMTTRTGNQATRSLVSERPNTGSAVENKMTPAVAPDAAPVLHHADRIRSRARLAPEHETVTVSADGTLANLPIPEPDLVKITLRRDPQLLVAAEPAGLTGTPVSGNLRESYPEEDQEVLPAFQEIPETADLKNDRWMLGSEFAPLYSYRNISSDYLESEMVNDLNEAESGMLSYAGGIRVTFTTNKRISVQSGLYYSRYGQEKNKVETFSYNNTEYTSNGNPQATFLTVSNSTGVIYSNQPETAGFEKSDHSSTAASPESDGFTGLNNFSRTDASTAQETDFTVEQRFDYLEIPLTVKYKIIDRKFDFSLSGGVVTNILVGNTVNLEQNGDKIRFGKTDDISLVNYLGSFGLGFEYPIAAGFAFSLEPRVRYYLNPIDKTSQINVHPYSFGIFAGVSYIF